MTANKLRLSAALIVRDEERHLEACLRSIQELADEIVVVDTGSVDGSIALARRFGARIHGYPWRDDFAAARNHGLSRCRGEWILYIDADERVRRNSETVLEAALADASKAGYAVWLHARTGYTAYREMRLFRNDPRIRFEGLMHETIWPGIHRFIEEEGGELGECDLVLDHVGYDGSQAHKHQRNLPLLKKALAVDPEHVYCWYHLGIIYLGLGRPELACRAWKAGIEAVRRKKYRRPADSLPFIELIQHQLGRGEDVGNLLAEARALFPDDALLSWLEGWKLIAGGHLREAIHVLERLAWDYETGRTGSEFGYDLRQFTSRTYGDIATCYYRLRSYAGARRYFGLAERHDPDNLEYRAKHRLCAHLEQASQIPTFGEESQRSPASSE